MTANTSKKLIADIRTGFKTYRSGIASVTKLIKRAIEHADAHGNVTPLQVIYSLLSSEADRKAMVKLSTYHGRVVFRDGRFGMSKSKDKVTDFAEWHSTNFRKGYEAFATDKANKEKSEFDFAVKLEALLKLAAKHGVSKSKVMKTCTDRALAYAPEQSANGKPVADKALAS